MEFGALRDVDQQDGARARPARAAAAARRDTSRNATTTGAPTIVADLNLAPLSPGDYVLELSVSSGADTEKRQIAFRLVR